jgi:hypothetical protein
MVDAFLRVLPRYPVGTQVEILDGRWRDHVAVVVKLASENLHRPLIRVLSRADGERVSPVDIDLRAEETVISGRVSSARDADGFDHARGARGVADAASFCRATRSSPHPRHAASEA